MLYMIRFILQNDACFAVLEVLAAVILVTFFFTSAQNPGIIPRNESIPQEPWKPWIFLYSGMTMDRHSQERFI